LEFLKTAFESDPLVLALAFGTKTNNLMKLNQTVQIKFKKSLLLGIGPSGMCPEVNLSLENIS